MSESVIQAPAPAFTANPARRVAAMFKALMEALVKAESREFEDAQASRYRFPPL